MNLKTNSIGEIVAENFRTAVIFKKHGIDFCCKGDRTIAEACDKKRLDPEKIYSEIENISIEKSEEIDFRSWPLDLLADYIEKTHHRYVKEKAPGIQTFLNKLSKVHGPQHPELFEIQTLFGESAVDLISHLQKEESILFPLIREMISTKGNKVELHSSQLNTLENAVSMLQHEHAAEGERFAKIAELTNNYNPPSDACNTYKVTYAMLEDFENDLHRHIHLENNILFPQSIELEKEFSV